MKNLIILLVNSIVLLFFLSCNGKVPTEEDIIGIWISTDNVQIHFYENHTFEMFDENKIVLSNFFPSDYQRRNYEDREIIDKKLDVIKGDWKLEEYMNYGYLIIDLSFSFDEISQQKKGGALLDISGNGIFGNKSPWYLFYYIGDPDENNRYIFHKKST